MELDPFQQQLIRMAERSFATANDAFSVLHRLYPDCYWDMEDYFNETNRKSLHERSRQGEELCKEYVWHCKPR